VRHRAQATHAPYRRAVGPRGTPRRTAAAAKGGGEYVRRAGTSARRSAPSPTLYFGG
jgi:hypothetical protein